MLLFSFQKILSESLSECQAARIQIRTDIFVGPDLDPNCLQILLVDNRSSERVNLETLLVLLGGDDRYALNPNFKNLCLFYEYFHGDTGRGCGARYVIMAIFSIIYTHTL